MLPGESSKGGKPALKPSRRVSLDRVHEGGFRSVLQGTLGCNLPLELVLSKRAGLSYQPPPPTMAFSPWLRATQRNVNSHTVHVSSGFCKQKHRKVGDVYQKEQEALGQRWGLNGAETLSIPVVCSVDKILPRVLLLRAHEQTSSPWRRVRETPKSVSQGALY